MNIKGLILSVLVGIAIQVNAMALDFNVKNVPIETAIAQLNQAYGFSFSMNTSDVDIKKLVSIDVKDASINTILDRLFEGQNVSYSVDGKIITVAKKDNDKTAAAKKTKGLKVSGKVKGSDGIPVVGAVILAIGGSESAITDVEGNYAIELKKSCSLEISCLGYKSTVVDVAGKSEVNVVLNIDSEQLEEVVVVGYGTQKKVNLTGSVSSVNVGEIAKSRPFTNLSTALAGMAAGVAVTSASNKPGSDNATIMVRGCGTLNTASPLVLVDGIESSFNTVNPQDVETISILKDAASAAIYGSRAANGVILITTKEGKAGKMKIEYSGYVAAQNVRKVLNMVTNYADYMEYANEAQANSNLPQIFSQASIDAWRNDAGQNPLIYPNTDWFDAVFKTGISHNHIISMNGGTERSRYYISIGYLNNPGVMENSGEEKFTIRANFDTKVNKWLSFGMKVDGYLSNIGMGSSSIDDVYTGIYATTPCIVPRHPDGRIGFIQNPEDNSQKGSIMGSFYNRNGTYDKHNIRTNMFLTLTPFKGFSLTGTYRYTYVATQNKYTPQFIDKWDFRTGTIGVKAGGRTYVTNSFSRILRNNLDLIARYNTKVISNRFGISVLAGMSQESYSTESTSVTRYDLIDSNLSAINACTGESNSSGSKSEWAMHSYFGRINLNWDEKYLFEANLRADGSSRFRPKYRWGLFPSFSAAWRISQEDFMKGTKVDNLKIRASYGSLGNNSVGNYDSQATFSKDNYGWGNDVAVGVSQSAIANESMTWETTYVTDLGVDFGLFRGRFNGTVDGFIKRTEGILINLPAVYVHGTTTIPKTNAAIVTNKGVELTLSWDDKKGDFNYGVSGNFTYVSNVVNKFKGDEYTLSGSSMIKEGLAINSQYGFVVDRIIQTKSDMQVVNRMILNNPDAFNAYGKPTYGDFLYKDLNNDGKIDENDRTILSDGPNPKYLFGLNLHAGWKGLDFSILMQGQAGIKTICFDETDGLTPFYRWGYGINKDVAEGAWRAGRTDATWPRLTDYTYTLNTLRSDFYLEDRSFLKIRNIQLGYQLPQKITRKIDIDKIRFYVSLENYFTFTKYRLTDPEVSNVNYPTMKQAVLGINISF